MYIYKKTINAFGEFIREVKEEDWRQLYRKRNLKFPKPL